MDSVTDQPSITWSWRSVLNFKLSVLTFSRLMSCSMSIEQKLCKVKIFQLESMSNAIRCYVDVLIIGWWSRIVVFRVWPWYSTWTILELQSVHSWQDWFAVLFRVFVYCQLLNVQLDLFANLFFNSQNLICQCWCCWFFYLFINDHEVSLTNFKN